MHIPANDQQHQIDLAKKLIRLQEAEELIGWIFGNPTADFDEIQAKCAAFLSIPLGRYGETLGVSLPEYDCPIHGKLGSSDGNCPRC